MEENKYSILDNVSGVQVTQMLVKKIETEDEFISTINAFTGDTVEVLVVGESVENIKPGDKIVINAERVINVYINDDSYWITNYSNLLYRI